MIPIKFDAKKWKTGNSYVVTIPRGVATILDDDVEYTFEITEKKEVE